MEVELSKLIKAKPFKEIFVNSSGNQDCGCSCLISKLPRINALKKDAQRKRNVEDIMSALVKYETPEQIAEKREFLEKW